jgi:hypothetical protein
VFFRSLESIGSTAFYGNGPMTRITWRSDSRFSHVGEFVLSDEL